MNTDNQIIEIRQGDDEEMYFEFTDEESGDPINLTGSTIWLTCKEDIDDANEDAVFQFSWSEHYDAVNGKSKHDLSSTETKKIEPEQYYPFDVQLVDAAGKEHTPIFAKFLGQTRVRTA